MQSYIYTPTTVKPIASPTFSDADMHALELAGVAHVSQGRTHWFSRECDADDCTACYVFQITEDDRLFPGIVAHMCQPYALYCKAHQPKLTGASLISYKAKSTSSGGNGGSKSKAKTHRPRKSATGYTGAQIKHFEAEIAKMSDWLAAVETGMIDAPADLVTKVRVTLGVYTDIVVEYRRGRKAA